MHPTPGTLLITCAYTVSALPYHNPPPRVPTSLPLRYQAKLSEAEDATKALRDRQRDIKDTHTTGMSQIDIMNDMIRLLQLKLNLAKGISGGGMDFMGGGGGGGGGGHAFDTGSANVLQL